MKKCDKKSRVTNEECPLSAVIQSSRLVKQCDSSENLRVQIQKLFCFILFHLFGIIYFKSQSPNPEIILQIFRQESEPVRGMYFGRLVKNNGYIPSYGRDIKYILRSN
jgi:hypothetical protein